jgi:UDP-arabinose 4-epimerase
MAILVTGGAGFIGSHTCKALAADGLTPIAFDNLSRGHADLVRWGPLVRGDILEPAALDAAFKLYQPKCVIHFAALAYVGESVSEPLSYYNCNVTGLINVLDAMVRNGADTIVFSSSCATYGIPDVIPTPETAPQRPINPYGRSKLMCEQILNHVARSHGLRVAILRYFNACGADPNGELAERHDPETHLIPLAIDAATREGPPLRIFGADYPTADGTCVRDFVHVSDLAVGHASALRHLTQGNSSLTINLGTGNGHSVLLVIDAVERVTGRRVPVEWADRGQGILPRSWPIHRWPGASSGSSPAIPILRRSSKQPGVRALRPIVATIPDFRHPSRRREESGLLLLQHPQHHACQPPGCERSGIDVDPVRKDFGPRGRRVSVNDNLAEIGLAAQELVPDP